MPEKKQLSIEKIKEIISNFESLMEKKQWAIRRYKEISQKYGEDLAEWVEKQDNLPEDDHGKYIVKVMVRVNRAKGKLFFYRMLLKRIQDQEEQAKKVKAMMSQAPAYPEVVQVIKVKKRAVESLKSP